MKQRYTNGWTIYDDGRWPAPRFVAVHDDFDAEQEPDGTYRHNRLICYAETEQGIWYEVAIIIDEHPHFKQRRVFWKSLFQRIWKDTKA
jgi:hypothetical protein